jgi:hypothetical protein
MRVEALVAYFVLILLVLPILADLVVSVYGEMTKPQCVKVSAIPDYGNARRDEGGVDD